MGLVKFGRPKVALVMKWGHRLIPYALSFERAVARQGRRMVLFIHWGRMPKQWELSFVAQMKSLESMGIPFPEVLDTYLPSVLGEVPSDVLVRWVGKKARSQPKRFVKTVGKMFGPSGKRIITSLEGRLDPEKMLEPEVADDEPFQSMIDAIQRAAPGMISQGQVLDKDRWKHFAAEIDR